MLHRHVQLAARATNRSQARRPLISPSFLAVQETFLTSAVRWRELKGALSRAKRRFLSRGP